jgi:hypothetical protein
MIASIMMQMGNSGGTIETNMFKHMVLNSLRSYRNKFRSKYGELVIATDTGRSWRREVFPYYKASRIKDRDASTLDWEGIHNALREVRSDLKHNFPYRVVEVDGAEADDIIGALCHKYGSNLPGGEQILIISGDKDFKQLQSYMNVEQYDPVRSKKITENNPEEYLIEHVLKGDRGDGVPNVLSADNAIVLGIRQSTMTKPRLATLTKAVKSGDWSEILRDPKLSMAHRNYLRNKQMIDLSQIPEDVKNKIFEAYEAEAGKSRDKIFNYLINNRMKHLMEHINEF